ncbi:MAG: hypothetical protein CMJ45_00925 [Planctomyces sp.]|nr:hypothetical protein [Planctomyces sp.]
MRRLFKAYWIGCLLIVLCLSCGLIAALYFEQTNHHFIVAVLLQLAAVFLALALAYLFFEQRTHRRQKNIDEAVRCSTQSLRDLATTAVIKTVESMYGSPSSAGIGPSNKEKIYLQARGLALNSHTIVSGGDPQDPLDVEHGFRNLLWVFQVLERLADRLEIMWQLVGPALMEYEALSQTMQNLGARIRDEGDIWKEFQKRQPARESAFANWENTEREIPGHAKRPPNPEVLPREAVFNLQQLSGLVVRLVDVLSHPEFKADPEYEKKRRFAPEVFCIVLPGVRGEYTNTKRGHLNGWPLFVFLT